MDLGHAEQLIGVSGVYTVEDVNQNFAQRVAEALNVGEYHLPAELSDARDLILQHLESRPTQQPTTLDNEGARVIKYVESTTANLFITGAGGTGKSYLLRELVSRWQNRRLAVIAFTGVAAINVKGETAHKFFHLPPHGALSAINWKTKITAKLRNKCKALEILILDEVSMASADLLDSINNLLQVARGNSEAFGGVRVILFGDPYQLPPVLDPEDQVAHKLMMEKYAKGCWFFEAEGYEKGNFEIIELKTNHRVDTNENGSAEFLKHLALLRVSEQPEKLLSFFNSRVGKPVSADTLVTLVSTNDEVDQKNDEKMRAIPEPAHKFDIHIAFHQDAKNREVKFERITPQKELILKEGAQVMFIKNDDQGGEIVDGKSIPRWVNGTTGIVSGFSDDRETIFVQVRGSIYPVKKSVWEDVQHELVETVLPNGALDSAIVPKVMVRYTQFPLRLAWAITIHKSQGQTYTAMEFDPSRIFADGQTYVAISRSKSLEGISMPHPITMANLKTAEAVKQFMNDNRAKIKNL